MTNRQPAFITGGSSGIGLELAKILALRGHDVAIFARDANKLRDAVAILKKSAPNARIAVYPCDVGDRVAVEHSVAAAIADIGVPGWAIANAGISQPGEFMTQDITEFETQMQVNYMGAVYFAKTVAPAMIADGGRLVFVSSGAAFFGIYGYGAYGATKFAMRGLAEVLRVELKPHNISVTLAFPPDTDTPQLANEVPFKPKVTRAVAASGGVWAPEAVANAIISRATRGKFSVTPGFQMTALLLTHSLIAPMLRLWQGLLVRKHNR